MKKLCFYTPPFPGIKSYYDMIDCAVEHKLDAVEGFCTFEFETPNIDAAKKIRGYADSKNITFPCFSVYTELAASKKTIENLKGYAEVAKILGSPYLHHTIVGEFADYNKVIPNKEELFENGVKAVREIYDYAENIGVKAIYEEQGYIFNGIKGFARFLDEVERDVGVVADFGNIYESTDDLANFVKAFGNKVVHAHIKDVTLKASNHDGKGLATLSGKYMYDAVVGQGDVKIKEVIDILKSFGYNGYYGLEFAANDDASPLIADSIKMIDSWL